MSRSAGVKAEALEAYNLQVKTCGPEVVEHLNCMSTVSQCKMEVLNMLFLLVLLSSFIEPGAMQPTIQEGDKILALNQMSNATFHCTCDECTTSPPYWSLENEGILFITENDIDRVNLTQRGITYSSSDTSAVISIPDTVENNNTHMSCAAHLYGGVEFSDSVKVTITGPPLPPEPILVINGFSQLSIQWEIPYSHADYPVVSYNIQIVNMSSGGILESLEKYSDTIYMYTFDDDVQYCQILSVNVTAVSALGSSEPGSASRGFPIAPRTFQSEVNVEVILQDNETAISFVAPFICDYQTASYTLTIEDITDPNSESLTRGSVYSGSNRSIMEMITSGLQNNHNYTLSISVVDEDFNIKVSTALDFSSITNTTMIYATTFVQQTDTKVPTLATTTASATTFFQQTDTEVPTSPTTTVSATTSFQQTDTEVPTSPTTTVSATTFYQQTDIEVPTSPTTTVSATTSFQQTDTEVPTSPTTTVSATTSFQQTDTEVPTSPTTTVSATTFFQQTDTEVPTSPTTTVDLYATTATTLFQQTGPKDASSCNRLSLRAVLMCLILLGLFHTFRVN